MSAETLPAPPPPSRSVRSAPEQHRSSTEVDSLSEPTEGETLIYVTTPQRVTRVPLADMAKATEGATLVVDTLAHALRVHDREVSLERRRALEPLVVQLLRRAREGLSADEILRAAGGPGPESADAEHRVRVLISRVRDLLGDPAAIERVRDAGEHGTNALPARGERALRPRRAAVQLERRNLVAGSPLPRIGSRRFPDQDLAAGY